MDTNLAAQRAARRFLIDRIRDDWDWPNAPDSWSASDEEVRGVSEFRERYYGTSSAGESESEPSGAAVDPYMFDSPDSIGDAVEQKAQSRKRKRRAATEEEMAWNEGLALFLERRDVWTGAAAVKKYGTWRSKDPSKVSSGETQPTDSESGITTENTQTPSDANAETLVPVALPLLPENPIRVAITAKSYPDIYNKIAVNTRTPAVPVNLKDMTRALVAGWKENGEWPPKAAPLDPLAGKKKTAIAGVHGEGPFLSNHPHMKRGMDSVKRIFHLNGHHQENGEVGNKG